RPLEPGFVHEALAVGEGRGERARRPEAAVREREEPDGLAAVLDHRDPGRRGDRVDRAGELGTQERVPHGRGVLLHRRPPRPFAAPELERTADRRPHRARRSTPPITWMTTRPLRDGRPYGR